MVRDGSTKARLWRGRRSSGRALAPGFSLLELLVVVTIIAALLAILIPGVRHARLAAKNASTSATLYSIATAMEAFRSENEAEYQRSNGYPPSYMHPNIYDENDAPVFTMKEGSSGRCPFIETWPRIYGAQYLPMMLMGLDGNGLVRRSSVPPSLKGTPSDWYSGNATPSGPLPRSAPYLAVDKTRTLETGELEGTPNLALFPQWSLTSRLPVIVDAFDRPILYYAPNRHGSLRNMMETYYHPENKYAEGPPIYYHVDDQGFTGGDDDWNETPGWDFGGGSRHRISRSGSYLTAATIMLEQNRDTLARYILDKAAYDALPTADDSAPLRPVNKESYLLITAGPDAIYGTRDDVSNLP